MAIDYDPTMRTAQSVAAILADSAPLTPKEIGRALRQQGTFRGNTNAINRALTLGADFLGFVKLADNRWTLSTQAARHSEQISD